MIDIIVHGNGTDIGTYHLGNVTPPDDLLADSRAEDGQAFWQAVVEQLWGEWREAVPEPDADSDFIEWLVAEKGWTQNESNYQVTIEA